MQEQNHVARTKVQLYIGNFLPVHQIAETHLISSDLDSGGFSGRDTSCHQAVILLLFFIFLYCNQGRYANCVHWELLLEIANRIKVFRVEEFAPVNASGGQKRKIFGEADLLDIAWMHLLLDLDIAFAVVLDQLAGFCASEKVFVQEPPSDLVKSEIAQCDPKSGLNGF